MVTSLIATDQELRTTNKELASSMWLVGIPKSKSPGESPLGQRAGLKPLGPVVAPAAALYAGGMKTTQYVHWQHGAMWIGYLVEFPDYWTQGETHEELAENLKDLHLNRPGIAGDTIP